MTWHRISVKSPEPMTTLVTDVNNLIKFIFKIIILKPFIEMQVRARRGSAGKPFIDTYYHDEVIKWKLFQHYWPFVQEIYQSLVNSPHKGPWPGALMFLCDLRLNKRMSKQPRCWWFETQLHSSWRHCNDDKDHWFLTACQRSKCQAVMFPSSSSINSTHTLLTLYMLNYFQGTWNMYLFFM